MVEPPSAASTLLDLLAHHVQSRRDLPAYTFWGDDESERTITFGELAVRSRAVGCMLREQAGIESGDRAILIFPPGLDFITAFLGCAYAGVLAVPATFPKPNRPASRLAAISADCRARVVLTTEQSLTALHKHRAAPELASLEWLAIDGIAVGEATTWDPPVARGDDLVFLQYTSGSTSAPKGVMVSHRNLLHNLETIRQGFGVPLPAPGESAGTGVSWLPAYHDMGLIGGILESLYVGGCSVLFSPTAFLRQPIRWLQAISRFGASVSGAPNFAYTLCADRVTREDVATLDLSGWRVAFCGAEPIHAETLERFARAFSPCGFRTESFYCCYGLAEATLLVTGGRGPSGPVIDRFRRSALARGRAVSCGGSANAAGRRLVGCGTSLRDQHLAIIDPSGGRAVEEGRVGEIWVRGPHVSKGYWGCEAENDATFAARLPGEPQEGYLRTGDLGFLFGDELFVTGRLRDLLVIRGRNHHPQDIELTAGEAHAALIPGGGAAFAVIREGQERLVIIHEVERDAATEPDSIFRAVRREVTAEHELDVFAMALIRRGSLPRTTSGKVRRFLCRERYESGALKTLAVWIRGDAGRSSDLAADGASAERAAGGASFVQRWQLPALLPDHFEPGRDRLTQSEIRRLTHRLETALLEWLARQAGASRGDLDPHRPFAEYGVDSLAAVELVAQLETSLRISLTPVMAWDYPTPSAMAAYLARLAGDPDAEQREAREFEAQEGPTSVQNLLSAVEEISDEEARAALEGSGQHGDV